MTPKEPCWMKNSRTETSTILLIGIGNTGRGDDGLGWLFLDQIKEMYPGSFDLEYRYQLQVEDAALICNYDEVLFIDATVVEIPGGCALTPCNPAGSYYFSSHMQSPEAILYLAETLYGKSPKTLIMQITGYKWELGNKPNKKALINLGKALRLFQESYILVEDPSYK
jgi:hydrogenase maturation protease